MAKSKYPFKRVDASNLVKRMVKEDEIAITRDIILFYKVYAETPRWEFWKVYDPGFKLNCMAYFLSEEGRARVKLDLAVFDLVIEAPAPYELGAEKIGPDLIIPTPKSLSTLLR